MESGVPVRHQVSPTRHSRTHRCPTRCPGSGPSSTATARRALPQEFVLGAVPPKAVPMTDVAIALDLSGEGAVSDYKKELQRRIWNERGHQRELPEFLLANGLISQADLDRAKKLAVVNERTGKSETARKRLRYRPANKQDR